MPDPTTAAQLQQLLQLLDRMVAAQERTAAALERLTATRPAASPPAGQARQLPLLRVIR